MGGGDNQFLNPTAYPTPPTLSINRKNFDFLDKALIDRERQRIASKLDTLIDELFALRREVLAHPRDRDADAAEDQNNCDDWLEPVDAANRFNLTAGQIRRFARSGCGEKQGGRWLVSVQAIKLRLGR